MRMMRMKNMIFINNTTELDVGDVVLCIPYGDDVMRIGQNYRVRRFGVESIDDDNNLIMFDLDNETHFVWDGHCDVYDDNTIMYIAMR